MTTNQSLFMISTGIYGFAFLTVLVSRTSRLSLLLLLLPAICINAWVVIIRYKAAWPMLPMYLGPVALPFCLGILALFLRPGKDQNSNAAPYVMLLCVTIALSAVCFPKDYYLPFLKSQTLTAHFFFLFATIGKGCFLIAAVLSMTGLSVIRHRAKGRRSLMDDNPSNFNHPVVRRSMNWTIWGFFFWTVSMFSGEWWSYLGWGTPVVWDDPAIATSMATWFFYVCLLHLHLTGTWTTRGRMIYTAAGVPVILILNHVPDLGPFRWPF